VRGLRKSFGHVEVLRGIDLAVLAQDLVFINGGQRGLQVRLNPRDAAKVLDAVVALLVA